jgi:8-oxo-dGTP pyrophosphatase MutT (NUDIX family)
MAENAVGVTRPGLIAAHRGPLVCVAFLITKASDPRRVCLIRHKRRRTLEMPGGKVVLGETLLAAALREALEEAGLVVVPDGKPAVLAEDPKRGIISHIFRGTSAGTPRPGTDAFEAAWFAADKIPWAEVSPLISMPTLSAWAKAQLHP